MKIHIVQKGDTLWEIAQKYNVDFDVLVQLNSHLASPEMIMPGMKIRIPADAKMIKKEEMKYENEVMAKGEAKPQQPQNIEVPKFPKLPEEKAVTLPAFDGEEEHYPTTMFPEMPVKQEKVEEYKPKEETSQKQPQHQEQQQQQTYHMGEQYGYQAQAQMMPAYYYPVMMPPYMGCGCCSQQMNMPYYSYAMDPRQYQQAIPDAYMNKQSSYPHQPPATKDQQLYPTPPLPEHKNSK